MKVHLKLFQDDFIFSEAPFPAMVAAIGTGKSMCLIFRAMLLSQESPNNLGVICRKEYTDLRDSTIKDFELYTGLTINKGDKEVTLSNGSQILFRHADEINTLKNINLGWFAMEQAEEMADSTAFDYLIMRLRRKVKRRSGFIIANTNGNNWIKKRWKDEPTEGYHLIEAATQDNADNLPADYIDRLKQLPEMLYRRYVLNSWEAAEGLCYPMFDIRRHVIDPIDLEPYWKVFRSIDYGYVNPFACLWVAVDHEGTHYVIDEHYEAQKGLKYHAEQIKKRNYQIESTYIDPSAFAHTREKGGVPYSAALELQDDGIVCIPASKSSRNVGISRLGELFQADKIKIFKNCTNLIKEIQEYRWKDAVNKEEDGKEEPVKKNDHACDALRYYTMTREAASDIPIKRPIAAIQKPKTLEESDELLQEIFQDD